MFKNTLLYAVILASTSLTGHADTFPGGDPITAADLTTDNPQLPAPPPEYNAKKDFPNHEQFARFAWRQFIYLNSPAKPTGSSSGLTVTRGAVDPSRNFVDSGNKDFYQNGKSASNNLGANMLVWETFAHRSELFPNKSSAQGDFPNLVPEYVFKNLTVAASQARFNNLDENSQIGQNKIFFPKTGNTPSQNPYDDHEILFEAKVNQVEYDYVKSTNGVAPPQVNLPVETIEIKAAWRSLTQAQIDSGRYHTAEALYYTESGSSTNHQVATFGLIGLHIIRKMTNYEAFVFSTFEHVDNLTKADGTTPTGLYFITTYNQMCYGNVGPSSDPAACTDTLAEQTPSALINNGVTHITVSLPTSGNVTQANGYDVIAGNFDLPAGYAGPIKVEQPPTITGAVTNVNQEVKAAMQSSGQFNDSVWQYYELKGIQPLPTDEDTSIADNNPLTQDFFLANNVIESSQPGVQLFKGGVSGPQASSTAGGPTVFGNDRTAANIQNVPGLGSAYNDVVMGGCMGCHGRSLYTLPDGSKTSIFSFLLSKNKLNRVGGFEADAVDESESTALRKLASPRYIKQ